MSKSNNLIWQRFGKLTVIERAENNKQGKTMWKCVCDCGKVKLKPVSSPVNLNNSNIRRLKNGTK